MQQRRVTQRDVAQAAGVTRPTVSLALRHDPAIPKATRDRILKIAETLGYAPDPVLSALAAYRWPASSPNRSTIAMGIVEFLPRTAETAAGYSALVQQGALGRAKALGLSASSFNLSEYGGNLKRLLRVMRTRGITGILLLPSDEPVSLDADVGWTDFSVVSATTAIIAPRFHQVIPNQLYNMTALIARLQNLGHRRIGGIFSEVYEQRTLHVYSMALAWFGHRDRILILPGNPTRPDNHRRIRAWLQRRKLDLVLAPDADGLARLAQSETARARTALRFVVPGRYLEQFPGLIGETAVRVLSGLIYNNEMGIPSHPQITTIDGVVREELLPRASATGSTATALPEPAAEVDPPRVYQGKPPPA